MGIAVIHGSEPFDTAGFTEAMASGNLVQNLREAFLVAAVCRSNAARRSRRGGGIGVAAENMNVRAEGSEELAGGKIPKALTPCQILPANQGFEAGGVLGIDEDVVLDLGRDESSVGFGLGLMGHDEFIHVPLVANAARIGGGIDTGTRG